MKANDYISNKERKLLLTVAFTALIFSIAGSVTYNIKDYYERNAYYELQAEKISKNEPTFSGAYCFPDKHPQFLFSIILLLCLTFSSLCIAKRYLLSCLMTIASFSMFVYWFNDTQKALFYNKTAIVKGLDRFFYKAGEFDAAVCFLLSILLFWQISILFRMLIKTLQKERTLP